MRYAVRVAHEMRKYLNSHPTCPEWSSILIKNLFSRTRQKMRAFGKSNQQVFDEIYLKRGWRGPGEISSGLGSLPSNSRQYEDHVVKYVLDNEISSIVDVGCGDFQVSQRILTRLPETVRYTGLDVSQVAIDHNQRKFSNNRIAFMCLDAASSSLPEGELVLVREVLQHISNADIANILPKLKNYPHALLTNTEHNQAKRVNIDIAPGSASRAGLGGGLWLELEPFWCNVEDQLVVTHGSHPTKIRTIRLFAD